MTEATGGRKDGWSPPPATLYVLLAVLFAKLILHALYLPAFEGPDEPFHLDRVVAFLDQPASLLQSHQQMSPEMIAAIETHPCGPSVQAAFGCSPFEGTGAFNVLEATAPAEAATRKVPNYESHQPPLYYLTTAVALAPFRGSPLTDLLVTRILSTMMVALGLCILLRSLRRTEGEWTVTGIVLPLLLPGAAEALVRAANEPLLFLWTAIVIASLRSGARKWLLWLLIALGPMIKLTAFAVTAYAAVRLSFRDKKLAIGAAVASCGVFVLQAFRGWAWGGTLELNQPSVSQSFGWGELVIGYVRTIYTFLKTTYWLGNWSFFRAPTLLSIVFLLLVMALLLASRLRSRGEPLFSHGAGMLTASAGLLVLGWTHRHLFGVWGGLGGWYVWGWYPWVAVAATELLRIRPGARRSLFVASIAFIVVANVLWWRAAVGLYGP